MALSEETVTRLEAARDALDEFYEARLGEVDRECRNLREFAAPINSLGDMTTSVGTVEALDILARVGVSVG